MRTTYNSTQHVTAHAETHIFQNSVPDFKLCAQCFNLSLNYFDIILYYFPSEQKFKEFSSTFSRNSSFQGLFKHPWNLKLNSRAFQGLQGVARTLNSGQKPLSIGAKSGKPLHTSIQGTLSPSKRGWHWIQNLKVKGKDVSVNLSILNFSVLL